MTQYNLGKYKEAIRSFNFLLKRFPDDLEIHNQMASTLMELGHHSFAILFFNKCINIENSTYTLLNRGIAYLDMKKYRSAKKDFFKSISKDKSNASAYFYLGIAHLYSAEFNKAASSFEKTLEFDALDHEALVGLAIANYHIDNSDKADHYFKKAKHILAENPSYIHDFSNFKDTYWYANEKNLFDMYYNKLSSLQKTEI